ncbi:MAG: deoxyribose-phosphate aldolase [Spirochaetales bacterium]
MATQNINRYLDHAVLKPELTRQEAQDAIKLGIDYKVKTVCVRPCDIELAAAMCRGTDTDVSTVLAFPHGCTTSDVKTLEAKQYIKLGADEIDMVVNFGYVRSGMWDEVIGDIRAVTSVAGHAGKLVKVIFETAYLDTDQIKRTTECAIEAKAQFVKTSTGFASEGATEEAVLAMVATAGGRIEVKPSGGIRDRKTAEFFVALGATRLGNGYTSTAAICEGEGSGSEAY